MTYSFAKNNEASDAQKGLGYLLYVNTAGDAAKPTWTLIGGLRNNGLKRKADEIDASHKGSGGWKKTLPGLRSWSIDLDKVMLANDTGAEFLEAAFNAGVQVQVKFERPDKKFMTGWASINELDIDTPHDDVATMTGTLNGDGPLSELTSAA